VSYSRIYLGVHYLGDILGGICVGLLSGAIVYHLYLYAIQLKGINKKYGFIAFSEKNAKIMTCAIWCNLLITVGVSAILCFVA
jgi:membrane-associated phospholipid phosphatase